MSGFKRYLSLFLAVLLVFTSVPVPVFAAEAESVCPAHTGHDAACGYADAVAGSACTHVCGENCPVKEVIACVHDHTASGCTYTEPKEAVYCGHACTDGTCSYQPAVPGVDCTCNPTLTHADTCASIGEGECDCGAAPTHEATCAPVSPRAEVPCDFVHEGCGCAEAVTGGWDCGHVCSASTGCVKSVCAHVCPGDDCGYVAAKSASPCTHSCGVCQTQALIDALPGTVTQDNLDSVTAQLTAIDTAKAKLSDAELALVDFTRYQNAIAAINELQNQPAAQQPVPTDTITGKCGENVQWSFDDSTGALSLTGSGAMNNYSYTSYGGILAPWNSYASAITSITIGEGITHIGSYAFHKCSGVTEVTIPASVKTVGTAIFYYCSGLQRIQVASGNTDFVSVDGILFSADKSVLYACPINKGLTSYTIPNTVTKIADYAFSQCSSLTSIQFGSKVASTGIYAFSGTGLTQVTVPATVTDFGYGAFSQCRNLTSATVPGSVGVIGSYTFSQCSKLTSVTLGSGITEIDNRAFSEANSLKSIVIPAGTTYIGEYAFNNCAGLKLVVIPSTVSQIDDNAFRDCSGLNHILYTGNAPSYIGNNNSTWMNKAVQHTFASGTEAVLNSDGTVSCTICTAASCSHDGSHTLTDNADGKTHQSVCDSCGEAVSTNESHVFDASTGLCKCGAGKCGDNLTWSISNGVLTIFGTGAMWDYGSADRGYFGPWRSSQNTFTSVVIQSGVTSVGSHAFYMCYDLTSVTIPNTVTSIGNAAFRESKLQSVTVPASVKTIGANAFDKCPLTNGITLNSGLQTLGDNVFYESKVQSVTIPDSVTNFGKGMFTGCTSLTSVKLPKGLTNIPEKTFYNCSSLTGVTIPEGVTWIGFQAFNGSGLTAITLPESLETIYEDAFGYTTHLKEITVPEAVSKVSTFAFQYSGVNKVTFLGCPSTFGTNPFQQVTSDVYYYENGKWNDSNKLQYGGTLNWIGLDPCAQGHTYTYTANDTTDSITIGCKNCDYSGEFTLSPPAALNHTGSAVEATVSGTAEGFETPVITYTGKTTDEKPCDPGSYTASITVGTASVSVSFTISSGVATVTAGSTVTTYDTVADAFAAASEKAGSIVTLLGSATVTTPLVVSTGDFILELNGFSITNTKDSAIEIASGAKLTVRDGVGGGTISGTTPSASSFLGGGGIENSGTLVLESGTLTTPSKSAAGLVNRGSFIMNGGTLKGGNSFGAGKGSATFNGGTISSQFAVTGGTMVFNSCTVDTTEGYIRGANVTIYGGTFYSLPLSEPGATVTIYDGTFRSQYKKSVSTTILYGGIFEKGLDGHVGASIKNMLADGYSFFDKNGALIAGNGADVTDYLMVRPSDNRYVVTHTVGSKVIMLYSLDAGIARAELQGGKLSLLTDITDRNTPVVIDSGKFTFDLAGHTLSGNVSTGALVQVNGATVTFSSTDAVYAYKEGGLLVNSGTGAAISVTDGYVGLNSGTYQSAGDAVRVKNSICSMWPSGSAVVNVVSTGGTAVVLEDLNADLMVYGGTLKGNTCSVKVNDGSVMLYAQAHIATANGPDFLVIDQGSLYVNTNLSETCQYSVKTSDFVDGSAFAGIGYNSDYVEGSFVPYETGYYILESYDKLYLKPLSAPAASINYPSECLTGLTPNVIYNINGTGYKADNRGWISIEESWFGTEISIVKAATASSTVSPAQKLTIPARPAAPTGIAAENETFAGFNDGKLTGVTTAMEYAVSGAAVWNRVGSSPVTNLAPGSYEVRFFATNSSFASEAATVTVEKGKIIAKATDFTVTLPDDLTYNGQEKVPTIGLPDDLEESCVTVRYFGADGELTGKPVNAGEYRFQIDISGSEEFADITGLTDSAWRYTVSQCPVSVTVAPMGKQLYTGAEVKPDPALTFTGVPAGLNLVSGRDYTLTYSNNTAVGEATLTVSPVDGSNYTFTETDTSFTIAYGVALPDVTGTVYVDGIAKQVEDGILWLEDENAKLVTTYDLANPGAEDLHTVYPTAMYVWELRFDTQGGYSASRLTELDNALQYSGTSIRITGNQGIRFITSVPTAKKSALAGSGLAGYKLVEYGTLMGWYTPGNELLYGVNAKSIAYDRTSGTDQVFNSTGDLIQFTGMLTDLELEQSTKDLMTRPYMVLERTNAAGETEQVVLYGGSIVRSIGYVAYQNKDVFPAGTSSYEFIWNILSYAYPDLYEQEYQG